MQTSTKHILDTPIQFLKGVATSRASILNTDLQIFTFKDLLTHFPFRHEDRSKFYPIGQLTEDFPAVYIRGTLSNVQLQGEGSKKRLTAILQDATGMVELVWFQGIKWIQPKMATGREYVVFGKPNMFGRKFNISHPEIDLAESYKPTEYALHPVYNISQKMRNVGFDSKQIAGLVKNLLETIGDQLIENLPEELVRKYNFISRKEAFHNFHFPRSLDLLKKATARLKFEELFFIQLKLLRKKQTQKANFSGQIFQKADLLTTFYKEHLPFDLTNAQKRVVKEIYHDFRTGRQMNRLLQGDVGSGKTIVAFICMLLAIDNGAQACLMAPTEILADQHFNGLQVYAKSLGITIAKLTGSSKTSERRTIHEYLKSGELKILVGTHALIEDVVQFENLGLCIIDEQHRFGVAQRAKLWQKRSKSEYPHVLVMTATPIPRTLAMTLYGDLDVSVIDELPAGRKPIQTSHRYETSRLAVFGFLKKQIEEGRQVYIVYPLIEESETLDYKNLMDGYESVCRAFPDVPVSIVHGKMKAAEKDYEMQRFVRAETKIMVATTVIEVGVNVPNASVMLIENAEKFGLSQLHQLRGRVGRGADQSYCILMSGYKISAEGRIRLNTMVETNNGFDISEMDLKLRGPGDLSGTQQSGVVDLKLTDLAKDQRILQEARQTAQEILQTDPTFSKPENLPLKQYLEQNAPKNQEWEKIS